MAKGGRKTKYSDDMPKRAYEWCAEEGFTDKKLCKLFEPTLSRSM